MIKVHNLEHSRSMRIVWLLEELELPYEIIQYQRDPVTKLAPESLKKIHPLGKAPIVQAGEVTLIESGAIVDYIVSCYGDGRLAPSKHNTDYATYLQWLHYAEGSAMPPLVFGLITQITETKAEMLSAVIKHFIDTHLSYMNDALALQTYFVGEQFTAADIMMGFVIESADGSDTPGFKRSSLLGEYANLQGYLKQIRSRPAYLRAMKAIGEEALSENLLNKEEGETVPS